MQDWDENVTTRTKKTFFPLQPILQKHPPKKGWENDDFIICRSLSVSGIFFNINVRSLLTVTDNC